MTVAARADIIALIAEYAGVTPDRITDDSQLLRDLGIKGGKAWGLFGALEERFGTDVDVLDRNFARYFAGTPLPAWNRLWALLGCAFAGGMIAAALDRGMLFGVAIWAILLTVVEVVLRLFRRQPPSLLPITVGDIVAAVGSGAWPEPPAA